jgi:phosphoribosylglycinamide formyltransferase-1
VNRVNIAVLVSGGGTNLQALLDAAASPDFPARIALVVSNLPTAYALERARAVGVATAVLEPKTFAGKEAFEQALVETLKNHSVEWVCLAGFMRLLGPTFLNAFPHRVLNIHPSLLPTFPGLHAVRQALQHGVKLSGCTVHLVDAGTDTGPILGQSAVPVLPDDDEARLAARILAEEHRLYPLILRLSVEGKIRVSGRIAHAQALPGAGELTLRNPGRG